MLLLLLLFVYMPFGIQNFCPIKHTTAAARVRAGAMVKTIKRRGKNSAQCATKTIIFEIKFIDSMNERMGVSESLFLILLSLVRPSLSEIQYSTHLSNILPSPSPSPITHCHIMLPFYSVFTFSNCYGYKKHFPNRWKWWQQTFSVRFKRENDEHWTKLARSYTTFDIRIACVFMRYENSSSGGESEWISHEYKIFLELVKSSRTKKFERFSCHLSRESWFIFPNHLQSSKSKPKIRFPVKNKGTSI